MDSRFTPLHQELHNVQMEVKQVQIVQASHAERLSRLERRQNEDAAIKSVWNPSPFPSVLGGTPQHGPVQIPNNEVFDDFDDETSQNLLGSLHLDADEEPTRRGAASRANSVRFDETTLHGSNWGQAGRQSGEFGPTRPSSGLSGPSLMERTYSHKSDGRHRSFPSIVRCWLTTQYSHDTLLYGVVCSGSQKSTVDYSLLKELDLLDEAQRNINGVLRVKAPVYFAEATVSQSHSRSSSPSRQVPYIVVDFEVTGSGQSEGTEDRKEIRIFIGSDTLRANSADLLLSQNRMSLFGNGDNRDRLSVPFVRPEDESIYKHITTVNVIPEKPRLNASAPEFVVSESRQQTAAAPKPAEASIPQSEGDTSELPSPFSPMLAQTGYQSKSIDTSPPSDSGSERQQKRQAPSIAGSTGKENASQSEDGRRESAAGIWGSWRQGTAAGTDASQRENGLSGYQPAGSRAGRSMKILKPQKSVSLSTAARTGSTYETPTATRPSGELRRKSHGAAATLESTGNSTNSPQVVRWENVRRSVSSAASGSTAPPSVTTPTTETKPKAPATRSNPVGGASAFSWMTPASGATKSMDTSAGKPKTPATTA
ncbi:hypothetical protein N0V93_005467 [Gnomoniopsis smithogilvyi]|uniref:Ubiquitin carboxyl-terminal hydrolase 19 n=1 Tax=Gnomoniopsis smithogilvyi TaxID=1191159 RepID=A0A9W9CWS0_9PEZI|nr:hypothetical protein N0V93_005467 [Gnomoniopsis smithogilvyi]